MIEDHDARIGSQRQGGQDAREMNATLKCLEADGWPVSFTATISPLQNDGGFQPARKCLERSHQIRELASFVIAEPGRNVDRAGAGFDREQDRMSSYLGS